MTVLYGPVTLPTLRTARLTLRPYNLGDIEALHALWTAPDMRRYLWDDVVISRERAEETVRDALVTAERERFGQWVLIDTATEALVGFCGFIRREPSDDPELMYGLARNYWGRGFVTEAASAVLQYGFGELGFTRVTAATDTPNIRSARVMERLGMRFTHRGTLNRLDTVFYELLRDDFVVSAIEGRTSLR